MWKVSHLLISELLTPYMSAVYTCHLSTLKHTYQTGILVSLLINHHHSSCHAHRTTIIESIKYAITGAFPPGCGRTGAYFVHDCKAINQTTVKAQVKLRFTSRSAQQMYVDSLVGWLVGWLFQAYCWCTTTNVPGLFLFLTNLILHFIIIIG